MHDCGTIWTDVQQIDQWSRLTGTASQAEVTRVIKVLLIDLDGVLRHWDPRLTAALETTYELPSGSLTSAAYAPHVFDPALIGQVDDRFWRDTVEHSMAAAHGEGARGAVQEWMAPSGTVDAAVLEVVREVRARGVRVILLTNATSRLDDDLATLGLADEVDGSVTSAQLGLAKPDPDVFSAAALRNGLMFSELAYVDSSPANVATAEILGIRSHLFRGAPDLRDFVTELLT